MKNRIILPLIYFIAVAQLNAYGQHLSVKAESSVTATNKPVSAGEDYIKLADEETIVMTKLLGLNTKQRESIAVVNRMYYQSAIPVLQDSVNPKTRKSRIEVLKDVRSAQLRHLLTPQQFLKFENAMAEAKAKADGQSKRINDAEMGRRLAEYKRNMQNRNSMAGKQPAFLK